MPTQAPWVRLQSRVSAVAINLVTGLPGKKHVLAAGSKVRNPAAAFANAAARGLPDVLIAVLDPSGLVTMERVLAADLSAAIETN